MIILMRCCEKFLTYSISIANITKVKIKTIITFKPYFLNRFFKATHTKLKSIIPFNILAKFILSLYLNSKLMFTVNIKMLIINKSRIEITILANCIILTIDTFKTGSNNRFLETKFTPILIMCTQTICQFRYLSL